MEGKFFFFFQINEKKNARRKYFTLIILNKIKTFFFLEDIKNKNLLNLPLSDF